MAIQINIAQPIAKKLKVLLYGPSGSGKTLAALSFPNVLLVDAEHGSDLYAGRAGVNPFHVAHVKTMTDLADVLAQVERDGGKTWQTLVIDPISVLYVVEQSAASRNNTRDLTFKDWGKINNGLNALYTRLTNLPLHVVVIAREAVEYETTGEGLKRTGVKPQADKNLVYMMDFVLRLNQNHSATVEKSRGVELVKGGTLPSVNWDTFEPIAAGFSSGATIPHESDEEAALREADSLQVRENAEAFVMHWRGQSLTDADLLAALKVDKISQWVKGRPAADAAVKEYIAAQVDRPAAPKAPALAGGAR